MLSRQMKKKQIKSLAGFGCLHFLVISLSLSLSSTVIAKSLNDRLSIDRRIRLSEREKWTGRLQF